MLAGLSGLASSCQPNYAELATYSPERKLLQVVVEIPAGTNQLSTYDAAANHFRVVEHAGMPARVAYLPCPGNQGFIPGTHWSGSAAPLQALVLAETEPQGTVLEVLPLGLLTLDDKGTLKKVILATPARPSLQVLPNVETWQQLTARYPSVQEAVEAWFQHQGDAGDVRIVGWKNEQLAEQAIKSAL